MQVVCTSAHAHVLARERNAHKLLKMVGVETDREDVTLAAWLSEIEEY
jgi:hypothetical protein